MTYLTRIQIGRQLHRSERYFKEFLRTQGLADADGWPTEEALTKSIAIIMHGKQQVYSKEEMDYPKWDFEVLTDCLRSCELKYQKTKFESRDDIVKHLKAAMSELSELADTRTARQSEWKIEFGRCYRFYIVFESLLSAQSELEIEQWFKKINDTISHLLVYVEERIPKEWRMKVEIIQNTVNAARRWMLTDVSTAKELTDLVSIVDKSLSTLNVDQNKINIITDAIKRFSIEARV